MLIALKRIPKEKQFFTYSKKFDKIYRKLIDNKVNHLFYKAKIEVWIEDIYAPPSE